MAGLRALQAVLSATVQVPDAAFERHSPFSPQDIGAQLATQIDAYVRSASLGYYPALDYFQKEALLDASLFEILDQLAWLGTSLVREEVRSRLRPLFASVQVRSMQAVAYSMPQVRPGQADAVQKLAQHLTPNRARFDLLLTVLRRQAEVENLDSYVERIAWRHLSDAFDTIEIGNVKIL